MKNLAPALLTLIFAPPIADGQTHPDAEIAKFQLADACLPMQLVVEDLSAGAVEVGLQRQDIEVAVRSRLRSARMYSDHGTSGLYIRVNVVGNAFSIDIDYRKILHDFYSDISSHATTWDIGATGTHGRDSGYILSKVSQYIDTFIDEYLRVNGPDCE